MPCLCSAQSSLLIVCWAGLIVVSSIDGLRRDDWRSIHFKTVWDIDWAVSDQCVSASEDKTCRIWDPETGELDRFPHLASFLLC
jgi:WD40 repeat protein